MQVFRGKPGTAIPVSVAMSLLSYTHADAQSRPPTPPKIGEAAATLAETEFVEKTCLGLAIDQPKRAEYFRVGGFTADQLRREAKYQHVKDIDIPGIVAKYGTAKVCNEIQLSWYLPLDPLRHKIVFKI